MRRVKENNYLRRWKAHKAKNDKRFEIWLTPSDIWKPKDRREKSARAEISLSGWGLARAAPGLTTISSVFVFVCVFVCLSPQTTDDIVSSAECSSDDEDLEECDSGHAGGMSVSSCACSETWSISPYLSLSCYRGASPPLASCPMGASSVT